MHGLSKSRILSYLQCPRRLWLHVHRPELAVLDDGAEARFAAGRQVGEIARSLAPGGVLIDADVTDEIAELEAEVLIWVDEAKATLDGPDPETPPGEQCHDPFECPFLACCVPPAGVDQFPLDILPRGRKVAAQLRDEGYQDLREVPDGRLTHAVHRRVWQVTRSGTAWLDGDARHALENLPRPHYYLDFETISFAVPI